MQSIILFIHTIKGVEMDNNAIKKLAIGLFILNLIAFLLTAFLGSSTSINLPQLVILNNYTANLQASSVNIAHSANATIITPLVINDNGVIGAVQSFVNILIYVVNVIAKILYFAVALTSFLVQAIILISYTLFIFIPSLLFIVNLGIFNVIFVSAYGLLVMVLGFYAINYILPLVRGVSK